MVARLRREPRLLWALFLAACAPPEARPDLVTLDLVDLTTASDLPQTDLPTETSSLDVFVVEDLVAPGPTPWGPCATDLDCDAARSDFCLSLDRGYPDGQCTHACADQSDCGADGACVPTPWGRLCAPRCERTTTCRTGYLCAPTYSAPELPVCQPVCTTDSQCSPLVCDPGRRICSPTRTEATNGSSCGLDVQCQGYCIPPFEGFSASGFPGGFCYSRCTTPESIEYAGTTLPQGDCPTASVCLDENLLTAPDIWGRLGRCMPACTLDTECRDGYACKHPAHPDGQRSYANGYCAPFDCFEAGRVCPSGTVCVQDPTRVEALGICAPMRR